MITELGKGKKFVIVTVIFRFHIAMSIIQLRGGHRQCHHQLLTDGLIIGNREVI